ncbi:hypothetical protein A9Q84_13475 [Halobacteriovorax marinus]|uniref:Uncharacterized protein n=1 Tax=Halobacteriovorax marinus TaxID=97084 RepID=A0A1Y5FED1_9BACT|nr:hypothetical protein A9Q84_13475 [Halobacteriovorax marinus]
MKYFLFLFVLLFQLNSFSAEKLIHKISKGKHHKGGKIELFVKERTEDSFVATIAYQIKKKFYVPISDSKLMGNVDQPLPLVFSTKEGYIQLETEKSMKVNKATLKFIARESVGRYYDTYKIEILPDNKKWKAMLWYHPSISSVGWLKTELTLLNIPVLGAYRVKSNLVK